MISPTYFLACRIFEDSGFHGRLRSVPEDEEGINVEYLRAEISKSEQEAVKNGNTQPASVNLAFPMQTLPLAFTHLSLLNFLESLNPIISCVHSGLSVNWPLGQLVRGGQISLRNTSPGPPKCRSY